MSWKTFKTQKRPSVKIRKWNKTSRLIMNAPMVELLRFTAKTKYISYKYDEQNKLIGCKFHMNKVDGAVILSNELNTNNSGYTAYLTFIIDQLQSDLVDGTYEVPFEITKHNGAQFLVLDINKIEPTTSNQMDSIIKSSVV